MNAEEITDVIIHNKFKPRLWAVCPNVAQQLPWEADVLAVSPGDKIHEAEVKVCASDLKRDLLKTKWREPKTFFHVENQVHYFWYAVPKELQGLAIDIAAKLGAGVLVCEGKTLTEALKPRKFPGPTGQADAVEKLRVCLYRLAGLRYWCKRLGTKSAP